MSTAQRHKMFQVSDAPGRTGAPLGNHTARRGIVGAVASCLLLHFGWCQTEDRLYFFVDGHGVPHYANQPLEPRYHPLPPLAHFSWSAPSEAPSPEANVAPQARAEEEWVEEAPPVDHEGIDR